MLPVLGSLGILTSVPTSQAAVIVNWEQAGDDVTASWSGTLDFTAELRDATLLDAVFNVFVDSQALFVINGLTGMGGFGNSFVGLFESLTVPRFFQINTVDEVTPSFGFGGRSIYYNEIHITGGSVGEVTQLSFDPSRDVIRFSDQTLAGMGVDSFNDTLAWTVSSSGDTISYTTIPEPSSASFTGLGSLALIARRRRALIGSVVTE